MPDSNKRFVEGTITGHVSAGANTKGTSDVHTFGAEPFQLEEVRMIGDGDASLSCEYRLINSDGEHVAPNVGRLAGGGEVFRLPVSHTFNKHSVARIEFDNGDSSSRGILVVLVGKWVVE